MGEDLNKIISLTFDEDPEVRKKAALSLANNEDPAALFALIELSHDKDPSVREIANKILEDFKKKEPELMSFAEMFAAGAAKEEKKEDKEFIEPISKLFERKLGKKKAQQVKEKILPRIEKISKERNPSEFMQEFITNYLDVLSDLDAVGSGLQDVEVEEIREVVDAQPQKDAEPPLEELAEIRELDEELVRPKDVFIPESYFKHAFEVMLQSEGDEKIMKKEMKRLIDQAKKEIELAFQVAKARFKSVKITSLTELRNNMRSVNTEPLLIMSVENREYNKTKTKKAFFTRLVVKDDEGNEGVVYLFDGKGTYLKPGMKIKLERATARTFKFSGETVLTHNKNTQIYLIL